MVNYAMINNTLGKMAIYLNNHNSICVGVSGGSDSNIIVHMIAKNFREYIPKIHFVFQNTGLEYAATLRHLDYMENQYDIKIDRIKGEPVPKVIRERGVPIISKDFSSIVHYAQKGAEWALKRVTRSRKESPFAMSEKQRTLANYLIENGPTISEDCCRVSKKRPFKKYLTAMKADLSVSGERKCEGGQRASTHKNCFEHGEIDKYMPLFFWDDETKQYYKDTEGIVYSDCYEVWGMTRTGCVGCPFNANAGEDLKMIQKYEPNRYKACMAIFGESYRLMDEFGVRKKKILE